MPTWHQISFQNSASPSMEQLIFFHDSAMAIMVMITVAVSVNMASIAMQSSTNRYLLEEQTTEIMWTTLPVFILISIAAPSLQILYMLDDPLAPSVTVKATGYQWFWSYQYSDFPNVEMEMFMTMLKEDPLQRLLDTDCALVLPINSQIRVLATSWDVIHAWTVPALGVKADAVPGRLNQVSFSINRPGIFYGQCSEICGANHSFMPIKLEAVPMPAFTSWVS